MPFNVYSTPNDPVGGTYNKKILIFPDKLSMDFTISTPFTLASMDAPTYPIPNLKYVAVHLSRLFGVDNDRIYASGFNDYSNWNLDTADASSTANAWCSPAQSNVKSNGAFTGITTFQNHVVAFKRDFTHEVYNNKNPFRIQDIYAEGSIDNRSIQDVDGRLLFVGGDNVKVYTGGNPRNVGGNINLSNYPKAVSGSFGNTYYLYTYTDSNELYTYNVDNEQWSQESISSEIISFTTIKDGIYSLSKDGIVRKLNSDSYAHDWTFTTDLSVNGSIAIKKVAKIQCLADVDTGAYFSVQLLTDNDTIGETLYSMPANESAGLKAVRSLVRMSGGFGYKLKFSGYGKVRIHILELIIESGGEKMSGD